MLRLYKTKEKKRGKQQQKKRDREIIYEKRKLLLGQWRPWRPISLGL